MSKDIIDKKRKMRKIDFDLEKAIKLSLSNNLNFDKNESEKLIKDSLILKKLGNENITEIKNLDIEIKYQIENFGGRKVISNEGGGNCLFHTLSTHLKIDYKQLRYDSVNYIINSWERFKDFALNPITLLPFCSKIEYEEYMKKDGSWGDHLSLLALCELYQVNAILIISENNKISEPIKINVGSDINILIRFNSEFHYEAII